jgi:16S rRNA (guanine527-N7)-methyltransferase
MTLPLSQLLSKGMEQLSLSVDAETQQRLIDYILLLAKWNKAYNLTAVRHTSEMVTRHLLDSLAIAPFIHGQRILDVGTGAGLPGIPLAIIFPERRFVLLDSNGKKTRFLTQAKQSLGLDNIEIAYTRVETYADEFGFDSIVSRAFASITEMLTSTAHLLAAQGQFLAMKGLYPADELQVIPDYTLLASHSLQIPGLQAERHLICIGKQNDNP